METFLKALGAMLLLCLVVFCAIILGTAFGALAGLIVGWFFGQTLLAIFAVLGLKSFAMWQIGAFLGFVGGFFKSSQTNNNKA